MAGDGCQAELADGRIGDEVKSFRVLRGQSRSHIDSFCFSRSRQPHQHRLNERDRVRRRCDFLAVAPQPRARSRTWQTQPRCASEQRPRPATSAERSIRPLVTARLVGAADR